jgi:hypothetical protein
MTDCIKIEWIDPFGRSEEWLTITMIKERGDPFEKDQYGYSRYLGGDLIALGEFWNPAEALDAALAEIGGFQSLSKGDHLIIDFLESAT